MSGSSEKVRAAVVMRRVDGPNSQNAASSEARSVLRRERGGGTNARGKSRFSNMKKKMKVMTRVILVMMTFVNFVKRKDIERRIVLSIFDILIILLKGSQMIMMAIMTRILVSFLVLVLLLERVILQLSLITIGSKLINALVYAVIYFFCGSSNQILKSLSIRLLLQYEHHLFYSRL